MEKTPAEVQAVFDKIITNEEIMSTIVSFIDEYSKFKNTKNYDDKYVAQLMVYILNYMVCNDMIMIIDIKK